MVSLKMYQARAEKLSQYCKFLLAMKTALAVSLWLLVIGANMSYCHSDKVDELLKRLNKPALKSIKSPDGDIIDCVHISQQPSLDHPSLKTHSIKMKPSYIPEGLANEKESSIKQLWHLNGMCPEETIPIRRTKREDILRASTASTFGKKPQRKISNLGDGLERAIAYLEGGPYYGTKATINVWNPYVQDQYGFSSSQIWVKGGSNSTDLNTIEAGWQVNYRVYDDYNTRLFIYWTRDGYNRTGCYDLKCEGFFQTNHTIALGGTISPVSEIDLSQIVINIYVWEDLANECWWLQVNGTVVGYWPTNLFTHLNSSSELLEWGGQVLNNGAMGSGHFPSEGYGRASFFNNIQIVNSSHTLTPAQNLSSSTPGTSPYCYDVEIGNVSFPGFGTYIFYGGPDETQIVRDQLWK